MSQEERILNINQLLFGTSMVTTTRDGLLFTLTKLNLYQKQELIQISDSTEIDHSISCQDFQ